MEKEHLDYLSLSKEKELLIDLNGKPKDKN